MDRAHSLGTQRHPESWLQTVQTLRGDRLKGGCDQVVIGNFQNAVYSVPTVYKLDGAPELIGYQVTDHTGAIPAARLWNDRGTTALLPIDAQVVLTAFILLLPPINQHATISIR